MDLWRCGRGAVRAADERGEDKEASHRRIYARMVRKIHAMAAIPTASVSANTTKPPAASALADVSISATRGASRTTAPAINAIVVPVDERAGVGEPALGLALEVDQQHPASDRELGEEHVEDADPTDHEPLHQGPEIVHRVVGHARHASWDATSSTTARMSTPRDDEDTAAPEPPYDPTGFVHAFVLDGKGGARALAGWADIAAWRPTDGVLWVSLDYSLTVAARWLADAAGLDPTAREALIDSDPRPRTTVDGDNLLVIARGINVNAGSSLEDMISIRGWFEPTRVLTLRRRRSRSVKSIGDDLQRGVGPRTTSELLATLIDRIVEHVGTHVDSLGDEIAAAEDEVLGDRRGHDLRGKLADQRRRAIALRRFLAPQREALGKLALTTVPWLEEAARGRLAQNADRMTRTVEELDAARDRAAVTQEELQSRLAELTNQRLYVLSVMTAVFLPLGFVCSLLGVNVGGVPLQGASWAFWALCGVFVVGVALQLWIFKLRGWLGR